MRERVIAHRKPFLSVVEQQRFGGAERQECDLGLVVARLGKKPCDARRASAKERLATAADERFERARFGEGGKLVYEIFRPR